MNFKRGTRRIVVVMSLGLGAFGLWQVGLALQEARAYQSMMPGQRNVRVAYKEAMEAVREKRPPGTGRRDSSIRDSDDFIIKFTIMKKYTTYTPGGPIDFEEYLKIRRTAEDLPEWTETVKSQFPFLFAGLRKDLKTDEDLFLYGVYDAEVAVAAILYLKAVRPPKGELPRQFTWWAWSQWWRWNLAVIAVIGLGLSTGLASVPWALFYLLRWVVGGFRSGGSNHASLREPGRREAGDG